MPHRPLLLEAPRLVLEGLAAALGSAPVSELAAPSGYTAAIASWVTLASGKQVFIKAASEDASNAGAVRNAIDLAAFVGSLGPELLISLDVHGWVFAVYEPLSGSVVDNWRPSDLPALHRALTRLQQVARTAKVPGTVSFGLDFGPSIGTWQQLPQGGGLVAHLADIPLWEGPPLATLQSLESRWSEALEGHDLLHGDLRTDNTQREANGELRLLDWTHRWTGPGWFDLVALGPDLSRSGLDPEAVLLDSVWADAPTPAVDAVLAGLAGYWFNAGNRPNIAQSPGLRDLQRAQGQHALRWLARRLG